MKFGDGDSFLEIAMHAPGWQVALVLLLATAAVVAQVVLFL